MNHLSCLLMPMLQLILPYEHPTPTQKGVGTIFSEIMNSKVVG